LRDNEKICGMIALHDHFRREPYLSLERPRADVDSRHAAYRRVRARRQKPSGSDGGALANASCDKALTWGDGASRMRPPSD
jgi:hypothetical protein